MINTLTSLRMIFALMVFGAHCYVIDDCFNTHFFKEGFVGVSFFFVLSGFIIAYNYEERMERKMASLRTFYVARFARIYPLHWLTLLVSLLVGGGAAWHGAEWWRHFLASFTLCQAYIPEPDYFFSFNSPSWSLCCEQLFYLSFPLLLPLVRNSRRLFAAVVLCALFLLLGMSLTSEELIKGYWYVNPVARIPDFLVGILLFHAYRCLKDRKLSFTQATVLEAVSLLLFICFYLYAVEVPKVYRYSCYYWLPVAGILLVFSLQRGWFSKLLQCRLLIVGGEISFGFYLIHLFVISAFVEMQKAWGFTLSWMLAVPLVLGVTVALSLLSYYLYEKPMNRIIKKLLNK